MASNSRCRRSPSDHGTALTRIACAPARRRTKPSDATRSSARRVRVPEHRLDGGEGEGAVGLDLVEGAGAGQTFERLLVD